MSSYSILEERGSGGLGTMDFRVTAPRHTRAYASTPQPWTRQLPGDTNPSCCKQMQHAVGGSDLILAWAIDGTSPLDRLDLTTKSSRLQ